MRGWLLGLITNLCSPDGGHAPRLCPGGSAHESSGGMQPDPESGEELQQARLVWRWLWVEGRWVCNCTDNIKRNNCIYHVATRLKTMISDPQNKCTDAVKITFSLYNGYFYRVIIMNVVHIVHHFLPTNYCKQKSRICSSVPKSSEVQMQVQVTEELWRAVTTTALKPLSTWQPVCLRPTLLSGPEPQLPLTSMNWECNKV